MLLLRGLKSAAKAGFKECTKCLTLLPAGEFYSKGTRLDSECKKCRRARRRATYLAHSHRSSFSTFRGVVEIAVDWELECIRSLRREVQTKLAELRGHDAGK